MMFGFRNEFTYIECAVCGTVQIEEVPTDIAEYYPGDYYSYKLKRLKVSLSRIGVLEKCINIILALLL